MTNFVTRTWGSPLLAHRVWLTPRRGNGRWVTGSSPVGVARSFVAEMPEAPNFVRAEMFAELALLVRVLVTGLSRWWRNDEFQGVLQGAGRALQGYGGFRGKRGPDSRMALPSRSLAEHGTTTR